MELTVLARASLSSLIILFSGLCIGQSASHGRFTGTLVLQPTGDGRHMKVINRFSYTDWESHTLTAEPGYISDGATIPRAAWTIVGGPWDGLYIQAAIVHDVGCDTRVLSWQATDRLFYEAMLDSNVPKVQALTMYYAVLVGGPRWVLKETRVGKTQAQIDSYIKEIGTPEPEKASTVNGLKDLTPITTASDNQRETLAIAQDSGDNPNAPIYRLRIYSVRATEDISPTQLRAVRKTIADSDSAQKPLTPEDIERMAHDISP